MKTLRVHGFLHQWEPSYEGLTGEHEGMPPFQEQRERILTLLGKKGWALGLVIYSEILVWMTVDIYAG